MSDSEVWNMIPTQVMVAHSETAGMVADRWDVLELEAATLNALLNELARISSRFNADFDSMCMIVLDCISGTPMSAEQTVHQLKAALENSGLASAAELNL